jgi:hypothetical protein
MWKACAWKCSGLRTTDRLEQAEATCASGWTPAAAVGTVYAFAAEGISVGLVFRLRQLRTRIVRVRQLLDCLLSAPRTGCGRLLAALSAWAATAAACARCTTPTPRCWPPRSPSAAPKPASTTSPPREYLDMVRRAAGGGLVMSFTTLLKLALHALALSAFWGGSGRHQLRHQLCADPAAALHRGHQAAGDDGAGHAAKLKDLGAATPSKFVDEVANLVRRRWRPSGQCAGGPCRPGLSLLVARLWGSRRWTHPCTPQTWTR